MYQCIQGDCISFNCGMLLIYSTKLLATSGHYFLSSDNSVSLALDGELY
jgi:hypothetical protein